MVIDGFVVDIIGQLKMAHNEIHEIEERLQKAKDTLALIPSGPARIALEAQIESIQAELEAALAGATTDTGDIDHKAVEAFDVYDLNPDLCGIPPQENVPEAPCPPFCTPDPCSALNWRTLSDREPIFNEGVCQYWVSIITSYTDVRTKTTSEIIDEYTEEGIKLILNFVGKNTSDADIAAVKQKIIVDSFVDFRNLAGIKVLIASPVEIVSSIADRTPIEDPTPPSASDFRLTVTLTREDLKGAGSMFALVKKALKAKYSAQYEKLNFEQKISGLPKSFSLVDEGDRLENFRKALIELLKAQGFKFNPARKKIGVLDAVEIEFKEDYAGVKKVRANNIGCEAIELGIGLDGGAGWLKFQKQSSINYPTTLAFVSAIPLMYDDITSNEPPAVDLFLKRYFYPPIEQVVGQDLTIAEDFVENNGCNVGQLVANLTRPALFVGSEVAGTVLSFPELLASTIPGKACLTMEGKVEQDQKFKLNINERLDDIRKREFVTLDPVFENLPSTLAEIQNVDDLYKDILDKLGVCGLSALALDSMSCLMKGLDIEVSMEMLVKSFIKNATERELESIFFKFHPGLQQFIRDSVSAITSIPLPWEAGYQPGSYTGAGVKYSADYISSRTEASGTGSIDARLAKTGFFDEIQEEEQITTQFDEEGNLRNFRARAKTTVQEQEEKFRSFTDIPLTDAKGNPILDDNGNQIIVTSPPGVIPAPGLGPRAFAGPFASAGSVGTALDSIQDNAIDILKDAIIREIENGIISADAIMGFIDKIPGAALIKGIITESLDCPLPPLFSPPLDDILKTLELDFCAGHYALTLPIIPKFNVRPLFGDIKTILIEAAEDAIEDLVVRAIVTILEKLLNFGINLTCEVFKDIAGIAQDLAGGSNFREIVSNNICGDSLNDAALDQSLNELNTALGSLGIPGVPQPTSEDMGNFMDGVSAILTQEELLDLLDGEPNQRAVSYVRQIIKGIPTLALALPADDNIKNLFRGMGRIFDRDAIRDRIKQNSFKPVSPSVCASPEHLEIFDQLRCSILQEKGLTEDQCAEQIKKLKDQVLCDFDALADILNENHFGDVNIISNPSCPTEGIYPREDPETKKMAKELFDTNYDVINATFMRELLTRQGLLNMILSDQRGAGFKKHNEFWVHFFGSALSQDLGMLDFYADKRTSVPATALLDQLALSGEVLGTYPDTVGLYLQEILAGSLNVNYESSTTITMGMGTPVAIDIPNIILDYSHWDTKDAFESLKIDFNYRSDNDVIIDIMASSNDDILGPPLKYSVFKSYDNDILEKINSVGANSPVSPGNSPPLRNQAYVFGKLLSTAWSEYTTNQSDILQTQYQSTEFGYITNKIIEKFAYKISQNARTFSFGYNAAAEAKVVELDYKEYGGTEKNPAFYLEPPQHSGWLGLYDEIIPEVEGCTRESILNFNSISDQTEEYYNKLKDDPRLQVPEACIINSERPFDRVMPRASLAGTDGAIMATVRLYVMESFLKGLACFSMFAPKFPQVYDDVLFGYISENIKEGLLNTGINFRRPASKERYYYTFLEEVVQNFGKKVDIGILIPTQVQIDAMERINNIQERYNSKYANSKKLKTEVKIAFIKLVESDCLILLNYYIAQQLEEVGKLFSEALQPSIPNLESWVFGSGLWMKLGFLSGTGPIDVAKDPFSPVDSTVIAVEAMALGSNLSSEPYALGYFPFILEKYIKVSKKATTATTTAVATDKVPQIYNMNELLDEVQAAGTASSKIGDNYESWNYGIRISMVMSQEVKSKMDSAAFSASISEDSVNKTRSLKLGNKFVIPVCSAEIPIPTSTSQLVALGNFDINCMIGELINTPEYKTLFNYCFPLQSLLSLVTIYTIETFLLSIGKEWVDDNGKSQAGGTAFSQFRGWDKDGNFKKTRKGLRRLFEGYYNSRDTTYEDQEVETREETTRRNLKVKRKVPTDKQIKWWQKRLQIPKPALICEEENS
jgi:hypothetical protein